MLAVQPIQNLDRLISKTELNPASKMLLRRVRKCILKGEASDPVEGNYSWSIEITNSEGIPVRMKFSMRRHDRRD